MYDVYSMVVKVKMAIVSNYYSYAMLNVQTVHHVYVRVCVCVCGGGEGG